MSFKLKNSIRTIKDTTDEKTNVKKILKKSFLVWWVRWKIINRMTTKNIYAAGTCLLRKAISKKMGTKNHKCNLLVLIALMSKIRATNDNKAEWWSTKGVPLEGYAKIEKHIA